MQTYTVLDNVGTLSTRADETLVRHILEQQGPEICTVINNQHPDDSLNGAEWLQDNPA